MVYAIETGEAAFRPTIFGFFIPVAELPGVTAAELNPANDDAQDKGVLSFVYRLWEAMTQPASNVLGMSLDRSNLQGQGQDTVRQSFSFTATVANFLSNGDSGVLPLPTRGANNGQGKIGVSDIFPGASLATPSADTSGAGIVIAHSTLFSDDINPFTGAAMLANSRPWLAGFFLALGTESTVRSSTEPSGIISRSASNAVGQAPIAAWTDTANPTTGIAALDLPKYRFYNFTVSCTFEKKLDFTAQTFDLNRVAT